VAECGPPDAARRPWWDRDDRRTVGRRAEPHRDKPTHHPGHSPAVPGPTTRFGCVRSRRQAGMADERPPMHFANAKNIHTIPIRIFSRFRLAVKIHSPPSFCFADTDSLL